LGNLLGPGRYPGASANNKGNMNKKEKYRANYIIKKYEKKLQAPQNRHN